MSDRTPQIELTLSASGSLAPDYFDRLYAKRSDPWEFETSLYESAKYEATLAALPRACYTNALELGCSIGVLTRQLASRCEHLLATDVSEAALSQARNRCSQLPQITFERRDITDGVPEGSFDLILVSEVGYYFSMPDLETLRARIAAALAPSGHLLLVHFTGLTNYPLTADSVHDAFLSWPNRPWNSLLKIRSDNYRLDLLERKKARHRRVAPVEWCLEGKNRVDAGGELIARIPIAKGSDAVG